jgi:hypothetical protein
MSFPESEIINAFESCADGNDVVICGYEHDFRDRAEAVLDLFLNPIAKISSKFPNVSLVNSNFQEAARYIVYGTKGKDIAPKFNIFLEDGYLRISSDIEIYNSTPYIAIEDLSNGKIFHVNPTSNGYLNWALQLDALPNNYNIGIAAFSQFGIQGISRYSVREEVRQLI